MKMLSAYLRADRVVRPYSDLPYPCLPLRGRWREAPEGENLSLLFSPPVSLALASPLTGGPWVPCIHSSRNEPMGPCHPYRLLTKVGRSAERNILIPTIPQKLPFYSRTMANVRHITSAAPAAFKTRAHSPSVAPVVQISSTSSKRFPANCSGDTAS